MTTGLFSEAWTRYICQLQVPTQTDPEAHKYLFMRWLLRFIPCYPMLSCIEELCQHLHVILESDRQVKDCLCFQQLTREQRIAIEETQEFEMNRSLASILKFPRLVQTFRASQVLKTMSPTCQAESRFFVPKFPPFVTQTMKADVAGCPKLPDHPLYVYTSENKNVRAAPYFLNLFSENCQSLDDDPDGVFKLRNVWINSQPRMERWTIDSDATFSQLSAIRSSKSPKILKIINDDCSGEIVGANPDFLVNTATLRLKSLISVSDTLTHSRQKVLSLLNTAIREATAGIDQYNNGLRLCLYLNSQDSGSHDSSDSFSVTPTPRVKRPTPLKIDCCTDTERQNVLLMGSSLSDPTLSPTENVSAFCSFWFPDCFFFVFLFTCSGETLPSQYSAI